MRIFLTAFIQVFLVSANTYFISRGNFIGIAICGFWISYFWSLNVVKISIGNARDRLIYSSGAMLGGLSGVYIVMKILN